MTRAILPVRNSPTRHADPPSRAQLALENENQHVFEYIKVEIARLKKSVGALSGVVDEELATLRAECGSLRTEVQQAVDTEWMQLTYSQVKESVAKLDADVKECRAQLFELSGAHSSAVAKLGADAAVDLVNAHKASVRRAIDEVEKRHDAFARAAAVFADELKIANPLALAPS